MSSLNIAKARLHPRKKLLIQQELQRALHLHQLGKLELAEPIYQTILKNDSNHFDALHLLGLVYAQSNWPKYAEPLFNKAIRLNPNGASLHSNYGIVLNQLGRFNDSLFSFDRAIQLNPKHFDAHLNRGNLLKDMERFDDALNSYGNCINITSDRADVYFSRANLLKQIKRFDEAISDYNQAIFINPNSSEFYSNRGSTFKEMNLLEDALNNYNQALILDKNNYDIYYNRGNLFMNINEYQRAIDEYKKTLKIQPDHHKSYINIGLALSKLNKFDEAIKHYDEGIRRDHSFAEAYRNRAYSHLVVGEFCQGFTDLEWRLETNDFYENSIIGHADLDVEFSIRNNQCDMVGKTIFVAAEQGIGDYIMFLSILPDLCKDASKVVCQLDHRLMDLFSRCFPDVTFVRSDHLNTIAQMNIDKHIRMGSLGYTYRRELKDFSGIPYLTPNSERTADWQLRLPSNAGKIKVGISWRGGTEKTNGADRSMALEQLIPLLDREDCTFVSLQYGEVEADIATFNEGRTHKLLCFPKRDINNFEDFAGLIGALDCVISVQNTTVHTCGALGKPCFAMLPFRPEWRYGASGDTMPWYKSVKLFRQTHDGKWSDVIEHISEELDVFKIPRFTHEVQLPLTC